MNLELRNATLKDLDRLMELETATFPPAEAAPREVFAYRLAHFPQWCLVAEADGDIVGLVMGRPTPSDHIHDALYEAEDQPIGDCLAVVCVETAAVWRARGIAAALVGQLIDEARAQGVRTVSLACKDHLIAYYERLGFTRVGISDSVHGGVVWNEMQQILQKND